MSSLVMAIIGHDVCEVGLVKLLVAIFIMVSQELSFLVDICPQVRASKHCVQHGQVGEQHWAIHERLTRIIIISWWWMSRLTWEPRR